MKISLNPIEINAIKTAIRSDFSSFEIQSDKTFKTLREMVSDRPSFKYINMGSENDEAEFVLSHASMLDGEVKIQYRYITEDNIGLINAFCGINALRVLRDNHPTGSVDLRVDLLIEKSEAGWNNPNLYKYIELYTSIIEFINGEDFDYDRDYGDTISSIATDALT